MMGGPIKNLWTERSYDIHGRVEQKMVFSGPAKTELLYRVFGFFVFVFKASGLLLSVVVEYTLHHIPPQLCVSAFSPGDSVTSHSPSSLLVWERRALCIQVDSPLPFVLCCLLDRNLTRGWVITPAPAAECRNPDTLPWTVVIF